MSACGAARDAVAPSAGLVAARVLRWLSPAAAAERMGALDALGHAIAAGRENPCLVLWRSAPALMATRAETRLPGFAHSAGILSKEGWPVLVRRSGGTAFAVSPETLQLSWITSRAALAADFGGLPDFDTLYRLLADAIVATLATLGVAATVGEVAGAPCAGRHDIAVGGRKIAGLAQRWSGEGAVTVEASLIVDGDPQALADRVTRLHELAGSPWRCEPESLASLERLSGGAARAGRGGGVTPESVAALFSNPASSGSVPDGIGSCL